MNEPQRPVLASVAIGLALIGVAVLAIWIPVVLTASMQGRLTNSSIVPVVGAVVPGAVMAVGLWWLVRAFVRRAKRPAKG